MDTNKIVIIILILSAALSVFIYNELEYLRIDYEPEQYILSGKSYEYDLSKADEKHVLPSILREISGISYYKQNTILCIQDEDGILFQYNLNSKNIELQQEFGPGRDYEGVEIVNNTVYVLDSDGDIFYFPYSDNKVGEVREIETHLTSKNDTEGLGYDPMTNSLLIACKGSGDSKKYDVKGKAIYRIALDDNDFKKEALFNISNGDLEDFLEEKKLNVKKHDQFSPSAIAVHPAKEGDIFVLASAGSLLLVLDRNGDLKNAVPLDPKLLKQPEGIAFDDNGNLLISSEGRGGAGYILKFKNNH